MTKRVPIVMALALSLLGLPARGYADERDGRDRDDRSREERSDSRSVKGLTLDGAHEVLRVADAALYELSEDAVLSTDEEGKFPVFDPAAAAFRVATSSLQGIAKLGTILCPASMFVTNPKADSCTVTATGLSSVSLFTGLGSIRGAVEIVIQLDNPVDSPELPVVKGTFAGTINFIPAFSGTPLGSARGSLTVKSTSAVPAKMNTARSASRKRPLCGSTAMSGRVSAALRHQRGGSAEEAAPGCGRVLSRRRQAGSRPARRARGRLADRALRDHLRTVASPPAAAGTRHGRGFRKLTVCDRTRKTGRRETCRRSLERRGSAREAPEFLQHPKIHGVGTHPAFIPTGHAAHVSSVPVNARSKERENEEPRRDFHGTRRVAAGSSSRRVRRARRPDGRDGHHAV